MESFHSILKKEFVYLEHFKTREEAKKKIFEYITCFYNGFWIHSSLDYVSPNQYANAASGFSFQSVHFIDSSPIIMIASLSP
ncbi:IS3 family transposase [Paenibacillus terrae]